MAAVAAAGVVAFSAGPASAATYQKLAHGCAVDLRVNGSSAYAHVGAWGASPVRCKGFVKNTAGAKQWTATTGTTANSRAVSHSASRRTQACVYAYYGSSYRGWGCTSWH